ADCPCCQHSSSQCGLTGIQPKNQSVSIQPNVSATIQIVADSSLEQSVGLVTFPQGALRNESQVEISSSDLSLLTGTALKALHSQQVVSSVISLRLFPPSADPTC